MVSIVWTSGAFFPLKYTDFVAILRYTKIAKKKILIESVRPVKVSRLWLGLLTEKMTSYQVVKMSITSNSLRFSLTPMNKFLQGLSLLASRYFQWLKLCLFLLCLTGKQPGTVRSQRRCVYTLLCCYNVECWSTQFKHQATKANDLWGSVAFYFRNIAAVVSRFQEGFWRARPSY